MKFLLLFGTALFLSSCSTFLENSTYDSQNYVESKNEKGETIYLSQNKKYPPAQYSETLSPTHLSPKVENFSPQQDKPNTTQSMSSVDSDFLGLVDFASYKNQLHLGLHAEYNRIENFFKPRLGVSMFRSDDEFFWGFDLAIRVQTRFPVINPFVGLGGHIGDTKKCDSRYNFNSGLYEENCEKKFLYAGYGEIGIKIGYLTLFYRDYKINRAGLEVPTDRFWGLGLVFGEN